MSSPTADLLKLVRFQLHQMHSAFLESLKYQYQLQKGEPVNAYAWFNVITKDSAYAWIKPFNEIVMDLDILLENGGISEADAAVIRLELDRLFNTQSQNPFAQQFTKLLVNDNDLMLGFHQLKNAREKITLPANPETLNSSEIRSEWRAKNQINSRAAIRKSGASEN